MASAALTIGFTTRNCNTILTQQVGAAGSWRFEVRDEAMVAFDHFHTVKAVADEMQQHLVRLVCNQGWGKVGIRLRSPNPTPHS